MECFGRSDTKLAKIVRVSLFVAFCKNRACSFAFGGCIRNLQTPDNGDAEVIPALPKVEVGMVGWLFISAALALGQSEPAPPETSPPETSPSAPAVVPERWALMKVLQGSYPGWLLDGNRMA